MKENEDRLYDLLPLVHRQRDTEQGWPLRALMRAIGEQVSLVEADINQLYENWFIETCQEWVVPYIGDLVGYRIVYDAGQPGDISTEQGRLRNKFLIPRREVANTIRYRRRKGTLYLLELLANQVAGWPARAVEFYQLLAWTQALNHQQLTRGQTADVRCGNALDLLDGPFDQLAHSVDVRRINTERTNGRFNIPSVGVTVWRLNTYSVSRTPAYCREDLDPHYYTFSVLSNDTPLYTKWTPETDATDIAGEMNLPVPIRRRAFELRDDAGNGQANPAFYGADKSLAIWAPNWHKMPPDEPVPAKHIIPADLTGWQYRPPKGSIAVDPVLGRLAFHPRDLPKQGLWVRYHYGFSANMGGGEYERVVSQPETAVLLKVGKASKWPYQTLKEAFDTWRNSEQPEPHTVIEIQDGAVYVEQLNLAFQEEKQSLQIRAANGQRPIIRLLDWQTARPDAMWIEGKKGCRFKIDGLLISGRGMQIEGPLSEVTIRHSTLVPGWWLNPECAPGRPAEPSLDLVNTNSQVTIDHSIIGSILVNLDEVEQDPIPILLKDSILDATDFELDAIGAPGSYIAHAALTAIRSTVLGQTWIHAINLAEDSIFDGLVKVARRQQGCMRFCYVWPHSRTPRRYRCQPDLVAQAVKEEVSDTAAQAHQIAVEELRVRPQFNSTRYGMPTYCQLALTCAEEIRHGASDESEMGAFHNLFQPQREANLRARLEEYAPAGMDAGIIFAS